LVEATNHGDSNKFMRVAKEQMAGETLRRDGVRLVIAGRTTISEVMRISTELDE
jgi:MSHA biogenesis protein MshE